MTLNSVVSPQVLNNYLILVDMKSGRLKYQSGRVGDVAKKRKCPSKSGRVGIYDINVCNLFCQGWQSTMTTLCIALKPHLLSASLKHASSTMGTPF